MTAPQIEQSYMSWRGYILQKDAYDSVKSMDALFFDLFHTKPWKNKRINQKGGFGMDEKDSLFREKSTPGSHCWLIPITSV